MSTREYLEFPKIINGGTFTKKIGTPQERRIGAMSIERLKAEYYFIQDKQSILSSKERQLVVARINYIIKKGDLILTEEGKLTNKVKV